MEAGGRRLGLATLSLGIRCWLDSGTWFIGDDWLGGIDPESTDAGDDESQQADQHHVCLLYTSDAADE